MNKTEPDRTREIGQGTATDADQDNIDVKLLRSGEIATLLEVSPQYASKWIAAGCPRDDLKKLLNWLARRPHKQSKVRYRIMAIAREFKRLDGDGTDRGVLDLVALARMLEADINRLRAAQEEAFRLGLIKREEGGAVDSFIRQITAACRAANVKRGHLRTCLARMGRVAQAASQASPAA